MTTPKDLDYLAQVIALWDDELMAESLGCLRAELIRRGKFDAANYVARARACVLSPAASAPSSTPA